MKTIKLKTIKKQLLTQESSLSSLYLSNSRTKISNMKGILPIFIPERTKINSGRQLPIIIGQDMVPEGSTLTSFID
jgi:hypothetical protein